MSTYIEIKLRTMCDLAVQSAESEARSLIAGRTQAQAESTADGLVGKLRRLPDALGIDAGRTCALNASSDVQSGVAHNNPWNARGMAIAGSLSRRGKAGKRQRVARLNDAHTRLHTNLERLHREAVRLHTLVDYHGPQGEGRSAKNRKRAQYQLYGVQAQILDLGGSL